MGCCDAGAVPFTLPRIGSARLPRRTVDQFLAVWNPPNAEPIVLERIDLLADGACCPDPLQRRGGGGTGLGWVHTKVGMGGVGVGAVWLRLN